MVGEDDIIPIDPDHKEDIEAYIDSLKQADAEVRKELKAQEEAHERVTKNLHATINTLEKDISGFKKKDPDGITGAEKEQIKGIADMKTQFEMFSRSMDISVNGYLNKASDNVRAEYGSLIAYAMKVTEYLRDRAFEDLGISIFPGGPLDGWQEPEWVSPEDILAAREAEAVEAGSTED